MREGMSGTKEGPRAKLVLANLSHKLKVRKVLSLPIPTHMTTQKFPLAALNSIWFLVIYCRKLETNSIGTDFRYRPDLHNPALVLRHLQQIVVIDTHLMRFGLDGVFLSHSLVAIAAHCLCWFRLIEQTFKLKALEATLGGDLELAGNTLARPELKWQLDAPIGSLADARITGAGFTLR